MNRLNFCFDFNIWRHHCIYKIQCYENRRFHRKHTSGVEADTSTAKLLRTLLTSEMWTESLAFLMT